MEAQFICNHTESTKADWIAAQSLLKGHMLHMADNKSFFIRQKYFIEGEGVGHLLATVVKAQQGSSHIVRLLRDDGAEVTGGWIFLMPWFTTIKRLYASKCGGWEEKLAPYQTQIHMSSISAESQQLLDQPLTLKELERSLRMSPNDKAPGSDGLPAEFYKPYRDVLLPHLLRVFQEAVKTGHLPTSMREAIIILILKPGKDPSLPGSYRLISLLPVDIKLLAKVLANRLGLVITEVVHADQTGFMPKQSTTINLRRLFINLQLGSVRYRGGRAVLSFDAAKAFDSVKWNILWAVL